ncbi:hypothetical protein KA037_04795, partial [Patescibacteria group bacterium]|nr:hypothetical protein [Patescibacteria group bacterium]
NFVNLSGLAQSIYYRRIQAADVLGNLSPRSTGTMFQYDFSGFTVSVPNGNNLNANSANNVSISLYDTSNNLLSGYNGTVAWSITGVTTPPNPPYNTFTIPATSGLMSNPSGIYTFANGLNITYPGQYQLTVYDVNNPAISGSVIVTVYGVLPSSLSGSISVTPQYSAGPFTVNLATNIDANYTLTGPFTTMNGTLNTTASLPTAFNTVVNGSYTLNVAYTTGFYVYTASTNVILDTVPPTVTVVSPSSGSTLSGSMVTFTWTGSEFGTPSFSGYNITVTDGTTVVQQTGYAAQSMTLTLPNDGVRTITVTAIDQAGNTTTAASTFTVDTTAPSITNPYPSQNTLSVTPFNFGWTNVDSG